MAAKLGLILVSPDTSPRDTKIEGITSEWDFGEGAGFYLDASNTPYAGVFAMEDYVVRQLPPILAAHFGRRPEPTWHHGSFDGRPRRIDARAAPSWAISLGCPRSRRSQRRPSSPWGEKAFSRYLGDDRNAWLEHDASALMAKAKSPYPHGILIDQGTDDQFLIDQLRPQNFEAACEQGRAAVDAQVARRLRPRLLLHFDICG